MTDYTIALDLAFDEDTVEEALTRIIADLEDSASVRTEILEEHGPGGGWPLVRFTASRAAISDLVVNYAAGDMRDAFDIALDVTKVDSA